MSGDMKKRRRLCERYVLPLTAIFSLYLMTACTEKPMPPLDEPAIPIPQEKPKAPDTAKPIKDSAPTVQYGKRLDFLVNLYQSHIYLTSFNRDQAIDGLTESAALLPHAAYESKNQSALLSEITFVHHGTLSKLYIPMTQGRDRYRETARALALLHAKKLQPVDFRLVTYTFPRTDPNAAQIIADARTIVEDRSIKDESYAFLTADRELDKFYQLLMNATPYEGSALSRLSLHYLAARLFFDKNQYELSRIALKKAGKALSDLRLDEGHTLKNEPQRISDYDAKLQQLKRALDAKDPSLLGKLDGWWNRLLTDE